MTGEELMRATDLLIRSWARLLSLLSGILFFHLSDLLALRQAVMWVFIPFPNAWLEFYLKILGSSVRFGQLWSLAYFILITVLSIYFDLLWERFAESCAGLSHHPFYSRNLHLFGMINIHKALLWSQLFLSEKYFNVEFIVNISIML